MPWTVFDMDRHSMRESKGSLCWGLVCMNPQGLEGSRDSVAVGCTAMGQVGGSQCVAVEDKGAELGSMAEEDIEAAVAVAQGHCPVSGFGSIHLLLGEDSRSVGTVHLGKVFGRLRMRSAMPLTVGRSLYWISHLLFEKIHSSSSAIFLVGEQLRIYSRMRHLFDRMTYGHSDLDPCSFPAELHNPPYSMVYYSLLFHCHWSFKSSHVRGGRCSHSRLIGRGGRFRGFCSDCDLSQHIDYSTTLVRLHYIHKSSAQISECCYVLIVEEEVL